MIIKPATIEHPSLFESTTAAIYSRLYRVYFEEIASNGFREGIVASDALSLTPSEAKELELEEFNSHLAQLAHAVKSPWRPSEDDEILNEITVNTSCVMTGDDIAIMGGLLLLHARNTSEAMEEMEVTGASKQSISTRNVDGTVANDMGTFIMKSEFNFLVPEYRYKDASYWDGTRGFVYL